MTAGRGIVHAEMPAQNPDGSANIGMQLWVDLPAQLKDCEPRYRDLRAAEIPVAKSEDGKVEVKVISGRAYGVDSLQELAYTPVWLLDVRVQPGGTFNTPLPHKWNAFIYTLSNSINLSSGSTSRTIPQYHNAVLEQEGDAIVASVPESADKESRFILVAGMPLNQPVSFPPASIQAFTFSNDLSRSFNTVPSSRPAQRVSTRQWPITKATPMASSARRTGSRRLARAWCTRYVVLNKVSIPD
jgi:redox-sensitive bicupin YhaK (pirin superfamily)